MVQLYTLFLRIFGLAVSIAALVHGKARAWSSGRSGLFERLAMQIPSHNKWIWMHVSSLGEFEQGRPLLERLRSSHPDYGILLTFYSPSGYLVRREYRGADYVTYMPLDTPENALRFVHTVQPTLAIFVKYDIWYHHLKTLEESSIPTFLISANLRPSQVYFKPWGRFLRQRLVNLTHIYTQTEDGTRMLLADGFHNVTSAGDTRLDRVLEIAGSDHDLSTLRQSLPDGPVLVAGSTWPQDEARLIPAIRKLDLPCIIAPHEISEERVREIEQAMSGSVRLSILRKEPRAARCVIVDTMGELAFLYAIGSIAYVGGGFGKGIHNILEPIAHGLPVMIGPKHEKFTEAVDLKNAGAVKVIHSTEDVLEAIDAFSNHDSIEKTKAAIRKYIEANQGATSKIYEGIRQYL